MKAINKAEANNKNARQWQEAPSLFFKFNGSAEQMRLDMHRTGELPVLQSVDMNLTPIPKPRSSSGIEAPSSLPRRAKMRKKTYGVQGRSLFGLHSHTIQDRDAGLQTFVYPSANFPTWYMRRRRTCYV